MDDRQQILDWIAAEEEEIITFLQGFVQAKSPNPPGDTREAMTHIRTFLDRQGCPYRIVDPEPSMPNLVGDFKAELPGRHLVLNGHIDCFPVSEPPASEGWVHDPWGGKIDDGKLYGRGACDMKPGTSASIWTYVLLYRLRDRLQGRLTLTAVSDEETFGPWGARYLMEHAPEVMGDCLLNGEPSSPHTIRYGEKGPIWLRFTVRCKGAHGAYTHASPSASRIAARLILALETLEDIPVTLPDNLTRAHEESLAALDRAMGPGAADIVPKVTLNIGLIKAGLKVNIVPSECQFEADIRMPVGLDRDDIMAKVNEILIDFPEAGVEELVYNPPSVCDPYGEMMELLQKNVEAERGYQPTPVVSLGGTDARLWRYHDIPAYIYGPYPHGMGTGEEHVDLADFLHVLRVHALSAYDYLMAKQPS